MPEFWSRIPYRNALLLRRKKAVCQIADRQSVADSPRGPAGQKVVSLFQPFRQRGVGVVQLAEVD